MFTRACPKCGFETSVEAEYCNECGTTLKLKSKKRDTKNMQEVLVILSAMLSISVTLILIIFIIITFAEGPARAAIGLGYFGDLFETAMSALTIPSLISIGLYFVSKTLPSKMGMVAGILNIIMIVVTSTVVYFLVSCL